MLAKSDQGQVFEFGDQLVIETRFNGKRVETRLPINDLDWLWSWSELLKEACELLAHRELS